MSATRRSARVVTFLVATAATTPAVAQQQDSLGPRHPEFMERSYIFKNVPDAKTGEWYEALLALHLPLRQRLQEEYDNVGPYPGKAHDTWAWFFSMLVNLRQTKEESAPVRTPSYMPKLTMTYFNVKALKPPRRPGEMPRDVRVWTVPFVFYGHYSNGQDGCLFESQQQQPGDVCVDTATVARPRRVNRRDGSFSSHYAQLGMFYRHIRSSDVLGPDQRVPASWYWSFGGQVRSYEIYNWLGGSMSKELRDAYGPLRLRLLGNVVRQRAGRFYGPGQLRIEGMAEWIPGRPSEVPPVRGSLEIARTMDMRGGWGVFARVYSGQDDYNLGFLTPITVFQLGLTLSEERMPAFHQ